MRELTGYYRHDVLKLLDKETDCVGVELGVAAGGFSARMVNSGRFSTFFGVDMYADTHTTEQYKTALRAVGLFKPYKLLRMTFDEAYDLFEDESLDFIYVDGYAHSGQEGGDTIYKWAKKVRVGGLIAGDDYHADWPLVQQAVDGFVSDAGLELCVTTETEPDVDYSDYPSWVVVKTGPTPDEPRQELVKIGKAAASRVHKKRMREKRLLEVLERIIGEDRYARLKTWHRARRGKLLESAKRVIGEDRYARLKTWHRARRGK